MTGSTHRRSTRLGPIGIWAGELRTADHAAAAEAVAELEDLGFGAVWTPGGIAGDVLEIVERLLAATRTVTLGTGILNIWKHDPADVGAWWMARSAQDRARILLGLGVSHGPAIGADYSKPLATMRAYLDRLDAAGLPAEARCLAALGPKMLELARDRSAGAHPYLTTPDHSARARETLGPGPVLAPEQGVVLERDPAAARDIARASLQIYLTLPNYVNNWRRLGFGDEDFAGGGSDRLVEALFVCGGGLEAVKRRVDAHLAAGADHVCLQVVRAKTDTAEALPRAAWRELARLLS